MLILFLIGRGLPSNLPPPCVVRLEREHADAPTVTLKLRSAEACCHALHRLAGLCLAGHPAAVAPEDLSASVPPLAGLEPPVLLVGEGDFSFGAALAKRLPVATGVVATTIDPPTECVAKYGAAARANAKACLGRGCQVHYDVDATNMSHGPGGTAAVPRRKGG